MSKRSNEARLQARRRRGSQKAADDIADTLGLKAPVHMGAGVYCSLTKVTPKIAKKWIDFNHFDNRSISNIRVSAFARDIKNGRWKITHQGLAFDENLHLIDGQHRIYAIIEADQGIETFVVFNLPEEVFLTLDSGKSRTFKDASKCNGKPCSVARGAILRRMLSGGVHSGSLMFTHQEFDELHNKYSKQIDLVEDAFGTQSRHVAPAPVKAALAIASMHVDHTDLLEFIEQLKTGVGITKRKSAVAAFRTGLMQEDKRLYRGEQGAAEIFKKAQAALQFWRKDEARKSIRTPKDPLWKLSNFNRENYLRKTKKTE